MATTTTHNVPRQEVQADSLPEDVVPIPLALVRELGGLEAEGLAGRLPLPCRPGETAIYQTGRRLPCRVRIESLEAGREGGAGVECRDGRCQGQDIGVEPIEQVSIGDLEYLRGSEDWVSATSRASNTCESFPPLTTSMVHTIALA